MLGRDQKVRLINVSGCSTLGWDESEIVGKPWFDTFVPERMRAEIKMEFARLMGGKGSDLERFENPILTRDGRENIISWNNTILRDEKGRIIGTLSSGIDITQERQAVDEARNQTEFLSKVIESLSHPFYVVNADDHSIAMMNSAARKLSDLEMTTCHSLTHGSDNPCGTDEHPCPLDIMRRTLEPVQVEHIHLNSEGEPRHMEVHGYPILNSDGNLVQMIEYSLDITEKKMVEETLRNALAETTLREKEVSALLEGARSILENEDFESSARHIFDTCSRVIGSQSGYVALLSEDGMENEVLFLEAGGLPCSVNPDLPMPIRGLRGEAYETGKTVYDNSFMESRWMEFMPGGHVRLDNVLFAPLIVKEKVVGIMGIANKPGGFDMNDARIATAFGELAAVALINSRNLGALQVSEERFRSLIQSADDCIFMSDRNLNLLSVNRKILQVYGMEKEEMVGRSIFEVFPPEIAEQNAERIREVFETGSTVRGISQRVTDGKNMWMSVTLSPIRSPTGEVISVVGISRDISDMKRQEALLRDSETEFRAITTSAHDGIIKIDNDGLIDFWNVAAESIFGYTSDEAVGRNLHDLLSPERFHEEHIGAFERFRETGEGSAIGGTVELSGIRKDGTEFPMELSLSSVKLKGEWQAIGVVRDITARNEADLIQEKLMHQLEEKTEELQQVIYVTSHDLRSPMVNIQGFSTVLDDSAKEISGLLEDIDLPDEIRNRVNEIIGEEITESVGYIHSSIEKMNSLIESLLKISRLGTAALSPIQLDMNGMMERIGQSVEFRLMETGMEFVPGDLPSCIGDPDQIDQVFSNLIDNAIKYRDPDRTGRIEVSGEIVGDMSVYAVKDNGIGIPDDHIEKVFQIFHRIDRMTTEGEGLGLTAVRRILDRHNGKIWVESKPGKGSTFFISLPAAKLTPDPDGEDM
jgi:PAS domain S-box-containing protein